MAVLSDILILFSGFNVGKTLAKKGVRGFLGVDFLATQKNQDDWEIIALEINIRLCATTFAFFLYITAVYV